MSTENAARADVVPADCSLSLNELAAALSKAQGEMTSAKKDALNPHFKSKYADLASVWDACRAALSKHGLCVVQRIFSAPDGVGVRTRLLHSSGQWIEEGLVIPVQQRTAQGFGSAITYARRYALQAMVGLAADEDDDGNTASTPAGTGADVTHFPAQSGSRTANLRAKTSARVADLRTKSEPEVSPAPTAKEVQAALWKRIVSHGAMFGKTEEQMKGFVTGVLGGKRHLVEADIGLVHDALAKTGSPIVGGGA